MVRRERLLRQELRRSVGKAPAAGVSPAPVAPTLRMRGAKNERPSPSGLLCKYQNRANGMSRTKQVFDVREPRWGHMVERQWNTVENTLVQGCLTPLPQIGDYLIAKGGRIARIEAVEPMENLTDGFFGRVRFVECVYESGDIPTADEIDTFLAHNDKFRGGRKPSSGTSCCARD